MSSPVIRGALIGGLIGLIVQGIFGFVIRNAIWIAAAIMLMIVLAKCTPDNPKYTSKRDILNSFDHKAVVVTNSRGILMAGTRYVSAVAASVYNGGKARIYDLRVYCEYRLRLGEGLLSSGELAERNRITADYWYGHVAPGATVSVQLGVYADGYLGLADPQSFVCEPKYDVETVDLLKEGS